MTLETFFEEFHLFAEAPNAVAKMRELVLWSAFSGGFSTHERDQPIPVEWIVEGAPKSPSIPSSWSWQRGGSVFDVIRGVSYKKSDVADGPFKGALPVLRANNIGSEINFDGLVYVPRENIRDEQLFRRGDILVAMSSGSKKLVGKAAPLEIDFAGSFGAFCAVIRNKSGASNALLARYCQSPQYTAWVTAAGRGIGINNLGRGDLDSLPVPIPPPSEQDRIVAKIDELMGLCDQLEAQQQEREARHAVLARAALARFADAPTPANLQLLFHASYNISPADLRKTILDAAVRGKFVSETKTTHVTLGEVIELISGQHLLAHEQNEVEQGIPYLTGPSDFGARYPRATRWTETPKVVAEAGDILITVKGAGVGKTNKLIASRTAISRQLMAVRVKSANPDFVHLVLMNAASHFQESMTGIAIPGIGRRDVLELEAELPPLAEQRRIVAKVDSLMALVDQLETQLTASRAAAANLLAAAVAELTSAMQSV